MEKIRLGRTGLLVTKTAFGALPIQRISKADAVKLVRRACEAGINYFDTANMYTDSEEKLGEALHDVRQNVVISTKSGGGDKKTVQAHIEQSLRSLRTDYIDLFQFHNPAVLPDIHDPDGPFAAALEAKQKGYIRHIGITNHRLKVAHEAIESGNFETLQFPFCYLATEKDLELVELCREHDMGFIAMKGLSRGTPPTTGHVRPGAANTLRQGLYSVHPQKHPNGYPHISPAGPHHSFPSALTLPHARRRTASAGDCATRTHAREHPPQHSSARDSATGAPSRGCEQVQSSQTLRPPNQTRTPWHV